MTEIPDDVRMLAAVIVDTVDPKYYLFGQMRQQMIDAIARALMAERERWLAPFVTRDGANEMEAQDAVERLAEWMFMNNAMFNYVGSSFDAAAIEARRIVAAAAAIRKGE